MPSWKKVVTSGSNAVLNEVTASKFIGDGSALTNLPSQTGTITALNNQAENRLVTIGSTTTELDGESNLTWNGSVMGVGTSSPFMGQGLHVKTSYINGVARFESGDPSVSITLKDNVSQFNLQYDGSSDQLSFTNVSNVAYLSLSSTKISGSASSTGSFGAGYIDNKLGIGTTSPEGLLHIFTADASAAPNADADELIVENSGNAGISILSGNTSNGAIFFGDAQDNNVGIIDYDHNVNQLSFTTGATKAMTINASSNVGIGTTSPNAKLEVSGSTIFGDTPTATHKFTGSLDISGSVDNATPTLKVHGSGSGIFEVKGTNGTLFSVNDIMSGSIFSANTIAGIPVIEAFSDQKVTLGSPSAPVTITALSSSMDVSGSLRAVPKTDSLTGSNNLDLSKNSNFNITITGNITLTPIGLNGRDGQSGIITLIQDSSGGHSITLNSLFKTPRGDSIAFDTTADGISLMSYYVIDASNVAVNYLGPFS